MTNFEVKHLAALRDTEPSALETTDLRDYTAQIVHLANNTDLMDEEQAQAFPAKAIIKKLRGCHKSLIDRYNDEQDFNRKLLLMHSATDIAHSSLIVEDDPLVKQNDSFLDALFTSLGVYDGHLTPAANETLLITLVHEQTQTWNDLDLTALVTTIARSWLTSAANEQELSPEEQILRHRLLTTLSPEATIK